MISDEYQKAQRIAQDIAATIDPPLFYQDNHDQWVLSQCKFEKDPTVQICLSILKDNIAYGHGLSHATKVAVDAGAIILVEGLGDAGEFGVRRLVFLAHLAGALHDIARSSPDHAHEGAKKAGIILQRFELSPGEIDAVTQAIANHEAFQPFASLEDRSSQLLSDALYDADKFRWGPDNFTEMIWDILATRQVPLAKLMERFLSGLKGIEKIRDTFRTATGKTYGPDFIDRGIQIGIKLYKQLGGAGTYQR